jgi:hypothetical protein
VSINQPFNGVPLMARGKVRVPLDHAQGLPAAENLNREQIDAFHGQSRGEGVPSVMEPKIFDLAGSHGRWERVLSPPKVTVGLSVREHECVAVQGPGATAQDVPDGGVHGAHSTWGGLPRRR